MNKLGRISTVIHTKTKYFTHLSETKGKFTEVKR
jgi:hypothetical protein